MSPPPIAPRPPAFWAALTGLGCCGGLMVLLVATAITFATTRPAAGVRRGSLAAPASAVAPIDSADAGQP